MKTDKNQTVEEPPLALSENYHKARRQFVLFSSILLSWEYVGVKIGQISEQVEGKVKVLPAEIETPFAKGKVTILHPEVIPVLIFLVVIYFGFRLVIEWSQCDTERRRSFPAVVDVTVSYLLGIAAVLLFVFQQINPEYRLADLASVEAVTAGLIVSIPTTFLLNYLIALLGLLKPRVSLRANSINFLFRLSTLVILFFLSVAAQKFSSTIGRGMFLAIPFIFVAFLTQYGIDAFMLTRTFRIKRFQFAQKFISILAYYNSLDSMKYELHQIYSQARTSKEKEKLYAQLDEELNVSQLHLDKRIVCARRLFEEFKWRELIEKEFVPPGFRSDNPVDPDDMIMVSARYVKGHPDQKAVWERLNEKVQVILENFKVEDLGITEEKLQRPYHAIRVLVQYGHYRPRRLKAEGLLPGEWGKNSRSWRSWRWGMS